MENHISNETQARVALVTGASAGIGQAVARRLLKDGWTVYAGARRVERPSLTANERTWEFFAPSLRTRLQDLDADAGAADRIRAALTELLPAGQSGLDDVSKKLGVGRRTLQRRLAQGRTTYQAGLDETRRALAMRYLESSRMAGAEIAFLLGFEDPSSFSRAFSSWTGHTPEEMRARLRVA